MNWTGLFRRFRGSIPALLGVGLVACQDTDSPRSLSSAALFGDPFFTVWDSVEIEVSPTGDSIHVGAVQASLSIGHETGDHNYLLHDVADLIVDSARDELYVADRGRLDVLVFGLSDGVFRRSIGRSGLGPGEFQDVTDIFFVGDTALGVWDQAIGRVSIFALSGMLTNTARPLLGRDAVPSGPLRARVLGHLAWAEAAFIGDMRSDPMEVSPSHQRGALVRLDSALGPRDTMIEFRVSTVNAGREQNSGGIVTHYDAPLLFSPRAIWDVASDGTIALSTGGSYSTVLLSPDPDVDPLVLWRAASPVRVSRDDRLRLLEQAAANPREGFPPGYSLDDFEVSVRERFSEHQPAVTDLMWEGPDHLWIRRFDTAFDPEGPGGVWDVLNVRRQEIEDVLVFDQGLVPMTSQGGFVYCTHVDSTGVMRVLVLENPLRRRD